MRPSQRSFQSLDSGPGPACGPHQLVYVSPPLKQEIRVAGYFLADLTVSSNLSGGNLVATLYHTSSRGSCAELASRAPGSGRIKLNLRHWQQPGTSRPFPIGTPTRVTVTSLPLATVIPAGDRLVLAIGATSAELLPDRFKPRITVATGDQLPGSLWLPVVTGRLEFGLG